MAPVFVLAQTGDQKTNKVEETTFTVKGVCSMCKTRIEEAALYTKGVKFSEWDKNKQMLKVAYHTSKVNKADIMKAIAKAGHDTAEVKATDEAYQKLPGCCQYRDGVEVH